MWRLDAGRADLEIVQRLSLWTERLYRIDADKRRYWINMADLGQLGAGVLDVRVTDPPTVVRVKEQLIRLERDRKTVLSEMAVVGASLYDSRTMEVLLPGGPSPDTFLSWMPGEPMISWWRTGKNGDSVRHPLPTFKSRDIGPNHH